MEAPIRIQNNHTVWMTNGSRCTLEGLFLLQYSHCHTQKSVSFFCVKFESMCGDTQDEEREDKEKCPLFFKYMKGCSELPLLAVNIKH